VALHSYVGDRQQWHRHLYLVQLAYNTAKSATTGCSPYEFLYAQPQNIVERILRPQTPPTYENPAASEWLEDVTMRLADAKEAIARSFTTYKAYYDQTHLALPKYKPGDFVSIRLDRHPVSIIKRNKLSAQKLLPYEILEVHAGRRALCLKLPENLGIHDVISVQNVDKAADPKDDIFGRHPEGTSQRIIAHRDTAKRGRRYRVRLKSRYADEDKWIYPGKIFENLPRSLCEEYDSSVLQAETMAASLMPDQPTGISRPDNSPYRAKPSNPGQGMQRPILYISRATLPYETRNEDSELEMACLAWAVGRLRQYLEGSPFKVFTDHSEIPAILRSSANTSYSLHLDKFRMQLMPFIDNMDIAHRPGKSIPHVDCLSRNIGLGTSPKDSAGGYDGQCPHGTRNDRRRQRKGRSGAAAERDVSGAG